MKKQLLSHSYLTSSVCFSNPDNIYEVFDMLDLDGSASVEFDEFYLLVCMLVSIKGGQSSYAVDAHNGKYFVY